MITWRTYRRPEEAPVPVVRLGAERYQITWSRELPDADVYVGEYRSARALRSGVVQREGNTLKASTLRDDIVLLKLAGSTGLQHVIARPQRTPTGLTKLHRPAIVDKNHVIVPAEPRAATQRWETFELEPVGEGLFSLPPGLIGPSSLTDNEGVVPVRYDYNPQIGLLYAETQEGDPLPGDSSLRLNIRVHKTYRRKLTGRKGPVTSDRTGDVLATVKRKPHEIEDVRQLPAFDPVTKWHAVGQAHYDGSPVGDDLYFIVRTDADDEIVKEAIDRTMPAGAVYRIEERGGLRGQLDFRFSENSQYTGLSSPS